MSKRQKNILLLEKESESNLAAKQMPSREIKAVLFDLGETLLNFGKVNTTNLFRQGAKLSYDFLKSCDQLVGNFNSYCWRSLLHLRLRHLLSNLTGKDFDAFSLFKKIGTQKGIRLNEEQWQRFAWLWYEPLSKVARIEPETFREPSATPFRVEILRQQLVQRLTQGPLLSWRNLQLVLQDTRHFGGFPLR